MSRTVFVRFSKIGCFTMKSPTCFSTDKINSIFTPTVGIYNQINLADLWVKFQRILEFSNKQVTDLYVTSLKHVALLLYNITHEEGKTRTENVRFYNFVNQRGGIRETLPVAMFFTFIVTPDNSPITI